MHGIKRTIAAARLAAIGLLHGDNSPTVPPLPAIFIGMETEHER